jgi:predicted nucleic acid-binding protein
MTIDALIDSNVVVANIVSDHQDHLPSRALFAPGARQRFAVAAHSFAEAYVTLTRRGASGWYKFEAAEAWAALEGIKSRVTLISLTPPQVLDSIRRYASDGGIGARLYDALIGQTALLYDIPAIVTWNTRHMAGLFPTLLVATPTDYLANPAT